MREEAHVRVAIGDAQLEFQTEAIESTITLHGNRTRLANP